MRTRVTALSGHPNLEIRRAVAIVLINSRVEWGQSLIARLLGDPDPSLAATIQEELKQQVWWESYRATSLPPAKPVP
jgi:hypothetical protein